MGAIESVPLADVELKLPGMTLTLVAPEAANASVLLVPDAMLAGVAAKEVIVGGGVTVTVAEAVTEPAELVAVRV